MSKKNKVYINSYDVIAPGANSARELFESICNHRSGIVKNSDFTFGKEVAIGLINNGKTYEQNLLSCVASVVEQSKIDTSECILLVGSCVGGIYITEERFFKDGHYKNVDPYRHHIQVITSIIEQRYPFKKSISFSTACTSSANAMGYGYELISKGVCKDVLIVGADSISYTTVNGFNALEVLSSNPCTPFNKDREGMNVSEAAAVLHLSSTPMRDNDVMLCGVGYSSDAYHITSPHPEGLGAIAAMQKAMQAADVTINDIGYINAHGTGTPANDTAEANAIQKLFQNDVPVSSIKSITGHSLGAAGAVEAIATAMALQKQVILPNTRLDEAENQAINLPKEAYEATFSYAMSNSFAFGGNNTSVILGLGQ
jgi:3-oxoacyl-[acyl-carrier-protein] synthase-1